MTNLERAQEIVECAGWRNKPHRFLYEFGEEMDKKDATIATWKATSAKDVSIIERQHAMIVELELFRSAVMEWAECDVPRDWLQSTDTLPEFLRKHNGLAAAEQRLRFLAQKKS